MGAHVLGIEMPSTGGMKCPLGSLFSAPFYQLLPRQLPLPTCPNQES